MKNVIKTLAILLVVIATGSCQKDEEPVKNTLFHTWEVKEFITIHSNNYPKNEDVKTLVTFNQDYSYQLKLDVNTCSGKFESNADNLLNIDLPACTEACCDSEFSKKFAAVFPSVSSYEIKDNTLLLYSPRFGAISCELVT